MSKFSQKELKAVLELFDGKRGSRTIAKKLGFTRYKVLLIYKELCIDNSNVKFTIKTPQSKICKICNKEKDIKLFRKRVNKYIHFESYCIECEAWSNKKRCKRRYHKIGKQEFFDMYSNQDKKAKYLNKNKKYRLNNKDKLKEYRAARVEKDRENLRNWQNKKRKDDPAFKLRQVISNNIRIAIKKNACFKKGSIIKYLPYTTKELKHHLEVQFESWMNWDNYGKYNAEKWDDNDSSTWTWQIDHIIPHSDLPYKSMTDDNFKKCWALTNLRPLSSKQNLMDGVTRARHKAA